MAKHKYYKYNTVTGEVVEEYLESDEDTLILMQNPLMEEEQSQQDMQIINNMMGTVELCEMVLPILESIPSVMSIGGHGKEVNSSMVDIYCNLVLLGKYTTNPEEAINGVKLVPKYYRQQVIDQLDVWGK